MSDRGRIICLIPAFNAAEHVGAVVSGVSQYVDKCIVIDDGSTDETLSVATRAGATVLRREQNGGKTAALQEGFGYAERESWEFLVTVDGDGEHSADDVPRLVDALLQRRADAALGVRPESTSVRLTGERIIAGMLRRWLHVEIADATCGLRCYRTGHVPAPGDCCTGYGIDIALAVLATSDPTTVVIEVPIVSSPVRKAGLRPDIMSDCVQAIRAFLPLDDYEARHAVDTLLVDIAERKPIILGASHAATTLAFSLERGVYQRA
ncbi:MAG: glycosyltransferase family 2 protein [Coriobacteriia bacterium]|nr:glycosyltransferase family 2 protein [Coriobacteriia bacterium]